MHELTSATPFTEQCRLSCVCPVTHINPCKLVKVFSFFGQGQSAHNASPGSSQVKCVRQSNHDQCYHVKCEQRFEYVSGCNAVNMAAPACLHMHRPCQRLCSHRGRLQRNCQRPCMRKHEGAAMSLQHSSQQTAQTAADKMDKRLPYGEATNAYTCDQFSGQNGIHE